MQWAWHGLGACRSISMARFSLSAKKTAESSTWMCLMRRSSSWQRVLESKVVELDENDLEEKFVKGGGNGGQKINKVRNSVFLKHIPTGLFIQCQKTRSLDDNRRVARKLLVAKLDDFVNGNDSKRNTKIQKAQKKKAKKLAKSRKKHLGDAVDANSAVRSKPTNLNPDDDEDEDEDDDEDDDEEDEEEDADLPRPSI